ncbi:hypothetical protein EST38_g4559 [Candolleomyces aberdarensis]|uniref:Uncharacterized protein n=1 Tax=Candolleomyces aberdarensis TaxID=2316362 RepID=A0A4Q2DPJ9_9AGAR|nr:hypothetical protein EST38_g4559 [Candolleomyces aberdarensis]
MSRWTRFRYTSTTQVTSTEENGHEIQKTTVEVQEISKKSEIVTPISEQSPAELSVTESQVRTTAVVEEAVEPEETRDQAHAAAESPRRFRFKRISFSRKSPTDDKPALSTTQKHEKREHAVEAARHRKQEKLLKSELRAKKNALRVQMFITGEPTGSLPAVSRVVAKPQLNKIKAQL